MRRCGFTLLEVVLAIGLAGAVLGLLTMAINMYLVRVDASRTQVESAQLARALLNQIAGDLHAARYLSPAADSGDSNDESADSSAADPSTVQGIFGTETELRIDRSAVWQWERQARQIDESNTNISAPDDSEPDHRAMPQTVRYLLGEGQELLAAKLAATGVSEELPASGYAGLYREQTSTADWLARNSTNGTLMGNNEVENAELIAPEVVKIVFAYFDGEQLLDEWDSSLTGELPKAVEIKLTLLEEPFEQATTHTPDARDELRSSQENLVEYRRFVSLTSIRKPYEAEFPQPANPPN